MGRALDYLDESATLEAVKRPVSDLIMWDRQTETSRQHATGEGIVGAKAGAQLEFLQLTVISFGDFKRAYPDADALTEETGFSYRDGNNPSRIRTRRWRPRSSAVPRTPGCRPASASSPSRPRVRRSPWASRR